MQQLLLLHVLFVVVIGTSQIEFVLCWSTSNTTTTFSSSRMISSLSSSVSKNQWRRIRGEEEGFFTTTTNLNMKRRKNVNRPVQRYIQTTAEGSSIKDEFDNDSNALPPPAPQATTASLSTNNVSTRREFFFPISALILSTTSVVTSSSLLVQHSAAAAVTTTANAFAVENKQITDDDDDDDISLLGPLASLIGTWTGNQGLNIVSVPSRKSKPTDDGRFELIVQPYREVLTFKKVDDAVRNRGGDYDQYVGAVEYKQEVYATTTDNNNNNNNEKEEEELIHIENGMLFYLDNIQRYVNDGNNNNNEQQKQQQQPPRRQKYTVARSATIPHGNSALLVGYHHEEEIIMDDDNSNKKILVPTIPDISTLPRNIGINAPKEYINPYIKPIDYTNPNSILQNAINESNKKIMKTIHISLDSNYDDDHDNDDDDNKGGKKKNHHRSRNNINHGVQSIPFLVERADTTRFQSDFWIEIMEDGTQQLQYSQIIDIEFHKPIGGISSGGLLRGSSGGSRVDPNDDGDDADDDDDDIRIIWPHVTVNTLTKTDQSN